MRRARDFWATVRPRTRRGAILATAAIVVAAVAVSIGVLAGAAMAWTPYVTYDLDRTSNARTWATRQLDFAGSAACAECHKPQVADVAAAPHKTVACESCHAALGAHVAERPAPGARILPLAVPGNAACIACHNDTTGRPASLHTIDQWQHYKPVCLDCHDPHTTAATRPPQVMHPLANLPECITCHGPEGFKARNIRHPDEATDDVSCLECHAKGRGPEQETGQ